MDVLTAIRTAWSSLPGRDPVAAPETPIERLIADTLAARGPLSRRALDAARGVLWEFETAA